MQKLISRRTLVNYALVAGAFLPALHIGREAAAAEALAAGGWCKVWAKKPGA
jgi:hypothetical protein